MAHSIEVSRSRRASSMEEEEEVDEWEVLPPNTCFLDVGLADIKDLFSKEIDYTDYFIEQPFVDHQHLIQKDDEKPFQQRLANETRVYGEEFVEEIDVEDNRQRQIVCKISEVEEGNGDDDEDEEDLGERPRSKRPLVAGIGEMLSIGAAVAAAMLCGFLLGGGRRQEQLRRADAVQFHDKALKRMVRKANGMNQVLVAKARGMPAAAMQPAAISFGGCFEDMLRRYLPQ